VRSPHVVQVLDHGITPERVPYIVMEYLEGRDMRARIVQRQRLDLDEVEHIVTQVCKALSRAHEKGIVHRDIKPENIFLCDHGGDETFVKLLDFGIAKGIETIGPGTRTGALMGSPFYMSPEQLVGAKTIDHRTDLWSLAVVVYEALTGGCPFVAETLGAMTLVVFAEARPRLSAARPDLPPALDAWFYRATAKDPDARFASAKDLRDAFAAVVAGARGVAGASPSFVALPPPVLGAAPSPVAAVTAQGVPTISPLQSTVHTKPPGSRAGLFIGGAVGMLTVALTIVGVMLVGRSKDPAPAATAAPAEASSGDPHPVSPPSAALPPGPAVSPGVAPAAADSAPPAGPAAPGPAQSAGPPATAKPHGPRPLPTSRSKHGPIY
jgi:serine/threonine-protein kinase